MKLGLPLPAKAFPKIMVRPPDFLTLASSCAKSLKVHKYTLILGWAWVVLTLSTILNDNLYIVIIDIK